MTEHEQEILVAVAELKASVVEIRKILDALSDGADDDVLRKRAQYLDLMIKREMDRAALRKAVIEKTIVTLIWLLVAFIGVSGFEYVKSAIHEERERRQ